MQKTLLICTILFIVLSAGNCKKTTTPDPPADTSTYQPETAGSEWNYATTGSTASGPVNTTYKLSATAKDTSASGKTYKVFTNSAGSNEYYNKTGTEYSRISGLAGLSQPVEVLYLKSSLAAAATWSEIKTMQFTGIPVPVNLTYTVIGSKFDTAFNGNDFKDVIRIKVKPVITGVTIDEDNITYLFAKNVGMISNKVILRITLAAMNVNTETKLGTYIIK